jgi:hypothetical protein
MNDANIVNKPGVNGEGKLTLPAIVGRLIATPHPLFAKNVADFGAETALEILESNEGDPEEHDFGTCFIRAGSLRQLVDNGEWFVDLAVENTRECHYQKVVTDGDGDPILKDGKPLMKTARYTERFVTVPLSMVEWLPSHPDTQHKGKTVHYCQRQRSKATAADTLAYSLSTAKGGGKTKSKRLAPADMAALLAQIGG